MKTDNMQQIFNSHGKLWFLHVLFWWLSGNLPGCCNHRRSPHSTAAHQASPFRAHTLYAPSFQLSCSCKTPCLLEDLLDSCCWCLWEQSVKMNECDTPAREPINWSEARVRGAETKNSECKSQTLWGVWAKIQKPGWDTREGTRYRPVFTLPRTS